MITENHKDFIENVRAVKPKFKLMGLDVGQKKIGIAFVSSDSMVVTPFKTVIRKNTGYDLQLLNDMIIQNQVNGLVIGLPLEISGDEGISAKKIKAFALKLSEITKIPITFEDERFTTDIAQDLLRETQLKRKSRDRIDDQVSAQIILEGFMGKVNIS